MKKLEWDESFSVNIAELDLQHQKLFDLINQLYAAWQNSKRDSADISLMEEMSLQYSTLEKLIEYTEYHFATEEKYMEQSQYPGYELQKKEHGQFTNEVTAMQEDFRSGKNVSTTDIIKFLVEWLKDHILGIDKLYAEHFNACGLH